MSYVFTADERFLIGRLRDARRVHVVDPRRKEVLRVLAMRGYATIVDEVDGVLIAMPTVMGVNADPFRKAQRRTDGADGAA